MKKLLAIVLILALIVPAAAMAADPDPIVGCWYMVFDVNDYSEKDRAAFLKNVHILDTQMEVHVFWFTEGGEIYKTVTQFHPGYSDVDGGSIAGTWTKLEDGRYSVVLFSKQNIQKIVDNAMTIQAGDAKHTIRKMEKQ